MAATVPVPDKSPGDLLTTTHHNTYLSANLNKLLNQGHRKLTVAQFSALTGIEDGDEVYLEVDATNGIEWHLVYRTAEATYKWRFLGGPPMSSTVTTSEGTTSDAYAALATVGPSVALPRAGDYNVSRSAEAYNTGGNGAAMSFDIGGTGAVDADRILASGNVQQSPSRENRQPGLTTVTLLSKYRRVGGTSTALFSLRRLAIQPVRIRHDA